MMGNLDIKMFKAYNSTSNFVVIYNRRVIGGLADRMAIIVHIHFDPDPAACASFGYKTPPYASYLRPAYLFNGGTFFVNM